MKVALGADHAGFELKEKIKRFLVEEGREPVDVGAVSFDQSDDYPFFAEKAAEMVAGGKADRAIVVCDTGIGVDIVANKVPGVRSALVHNEELASRTREHNDTNVLALGAMFLDEEKARRIVRTGLIPISAAPTDTLAESAKCGYRAPRDNLPGRGDVTMTGSEARAERLDAESSPLSSHRDAA